MFVGKGAVLFGKGAPGLDGFFQRLASAAARRPFSSVRKSVSREFDHPGTLVRHPSNLSDELLIAKLAPPIA
jgi:hypothetical protein